MAQNKLLSGTLSFLLLLKQCWLDGQLCQNKPQAILCTLTAKRLCIIPEALLSTSQAGLGFMPVLNRSFLVRDTHSVFSLWEHAWSWDTSSICPNRMQPDATSSLPAPSPLCPAVQCIQRWVTTEHEETQSPLDRTAGGSGLPITLCFFLLSP